MKALTILSREHAAIRALLTRFEAEITQGARSGEFDGEAVDRLLEFCERVIDGHHQEKEERVFLPCLTRRARGSDREVLAALGDEHTLQRKLLSHMRNQIEGASYGEPNSIAVLVRLARNYFQHQREHSRWEQQVLFPLAQRILLAEDDAALLRGFAGLDEALGTTVWEDACSLAEWLDQRRSLVPA
jgi:hemerythrin-like domain-containing protein